MAGPDAARARWLKLADRLRVQDWTLIETADAFGPSGAFDYWYVYEHRDGRRATMSADGRCTDPELEALLAARAPASSKPSPGLQALRLLVIPIWSRLARARGAATPRH
jgi:hypothetical protein